MKSIDVDSASGASSGAPTVSASLPASIINLLDAERFADGADAALVAATKAAFPIGARVLFRFDRNRKKYELIGEVTGHGGTGYYAGYINFKNDATGKVRLVHAPFHVRQRELELLP